MKLAFRSFLMFMVTFTVMGLAGNIAKADAPHAIDGLYVWLDRGYLDSANGFMAELSWYYDKGNTDVKGFYIYQAEGKTDNPSDFSLVATIDLSNQEDFWFGNDSAYWAMLPTTYSLSTFYITAYNDDGASDPSNFAVAELQKVGEYYYLYMNQDSSQNLRVGEEFTTQIMAYTNIENPTITFSLSDEPDGMTIDAETGVITWTPSAGGYYYFTVNATITTDDDATVRTFSQGFDLRVAQCEIGGSIKGSITDSKGNAIENGMIYAYQYSYWGKDSINYQIPVPSGQCAIIDGEYELTDLDKGDYYLLAYDNYGYLNLPTFYANAADFDNATAVPVECGQPTTASWSLLRNTTILRFTTTPETTSIKLGETFTYDADAEGGDESQPLTFAIMQGPAGATIDAETGVLQFTPSHNGVYSFGISVSRTNDSLNGYLQYDFQYFTVQVVNCDQLSSIALNVKDEEGSTINLGYAIVFQQVDSIDATGNFGYSQSIKFENGIAQFDNLDAGTYYVQVYGYEMSHVDSTWNDTLVTTFKQYYNTWYKDALKFEDATPITIDCNSNFTDDVILKLRPEPTYNTVSGRVTDETDNSPVPNAFISFSGIEKVTGEYNFSGTVSDENGNYTVSLTDDYNWTVYCEPFKLRYWGTDSMNTECKMYYPEYYDNVTSPLDATVLDLSQSYTDINFALTPVPSFDNSLQGKVASSNGAGIPNVMVIAFLMDPDNGNEDMLYFSRTATTDANGSYSFANMIPGEYIMFAWDDNMEFAPGYYHEGTAVVQEWESATQVYVPESGNSDDYTITMDLFQTIKGICSVHGKVGKEKNTTKVGDEVQGSDALQGAVVYVTDLNGKTIRSISTKDDGSFEMGNLAPGTYRLVAGKVGYQTYSSEFTVGESNPQAQEEVLLNAGVSGVKDDPNAVTSVTAYPNPVRTMLSVKFEAQAGTGTVKMMDNTGKVVFVSKINTVPGMNEVKIKTSEMAQGAYFITINANGGTSMVPVTVAK